MGYWVAVSKGTNWAVREINDVEDDTLQVEEVVLSIFGCNVFEWEQLEETPVEFDDVICIVDAPLTINSALCDKDFMEVSSEFAVK